MRISERVKNDFNNALISGISGYVKTDISIAKVRRANIKELERQEEDQMS